MRFDLHCVELICSALYVLCFDVAVVCRVAALVSFSSCLFDVGVLLFLGVFRRVVM